MANNSQTWKKAEAQKIDNSKKRMSMSPTMMIGHPSSWSHSTEDVNMGTSPPSVGNANIPQNYHLFSKSLESGRSFMSLFASSKHNGTKDLGTSPPNDYGIHKVDDKDLLGLEGHEEDLSTNDSLPTNSFIDVPQNSVPRRKRLVSSGATLNYLRTSNNIGPVQYHKWTPFNPTNNSLILFDDIMNEPSDIPPLHSLIVKDLVPAGFTVYSVIGGKIFSRDDIHRFIKSVISLRSHVFVFCKSVGSLVVLDYVLRHQGNIKGIVLLQPVITLSETKLKSTTSSLTRKIVKSLASHQHSFNDELLKLSRYVTKNLEKLTLATLFLQVMDDTYNTNLKLYQQLTANKQMMVYPSSFNDRLASTRSKLKNDIKQWLLLHYCTFQESFIGKSNWSLLPQEIKTFIFSLLETKTLCRVSIVSKSWRNLTSISLEEIDLSNKSFYDSRNYIRYIASFPFLKKLNLEGWAAISDKDVEYISQRCQVLHSLNLSGCWKITDDSLSALAENCLHLRQLNFRSCPKITNEGLILLVRSCHFITSLNLSKCTRIDSYALYEISKECKYLIELDLSYFKIGRIQAGLKYCSQLEILYLEGRQLRTSDDEDNDDSNAHLEEIFETLPNLRILSLKGSSKVTPAVKANIAKYCTKLESLFV